MTELTKDGFTFDGWYTDSKFTTKYNFNTKITKAITLYAKWTGKEIDEPEDNIKDEKTPPTSEWENPFIDVSDNDWFFDDVKNANQNGIMRGVTNSEFAPNENITREQIAAIIYRYAEYKGAVLSDEWETALTYADAKDISDCVVEAVMYCTFKGIVQGKKNNCFAPKENAVRAEAAAILNRFIESNK